MPIASALRVLILDDVRDSADSLGMLLRLWGYEPLVAYTGAAALELAASQPPDVALLDLALPGLSGFDVARCLRQRSELDATALIAVTGYADAPTRQRAINSGFESVLIKPVDPAEVEALLQLYAGQVLARTAPLVKKTKRLPAPKTQCPGTPADAGSPPGGRSLER